MDRHDRVTQECVNSWSGSDLYNCFREVTDCIHSIENREGFTQIGWKQDPKNGEISKNLCNEKK